MPEIDNEEKMKHQVAAEFKYSQVLMKTASSKMDKLSENENKTFELGEAEKSVMMNINNMGLAQGAVAGMAALFLLRRVRGFLFKRMVNTYEKHNPESTMTAGLSSPFRQQKNAVEIAGSSPVWVGLGWVTDLAASFMVAVTISVAFTDQKKILGQLADVPLVEGKSHVSRVFCPAIQEALAKMRQEASTQAEKDALSKPRTPYLAAWIIFSQNCKLRQAHEQLIRRQQGLGEDEVVSIPPPGVPKEQGSASPDELLSEFDSDGNTTPFDDFYDPRDEEDGGIDFADTIDDPSKENKKDSRRR